MALFTVNGDVSVQATEGESIASMQLDMTGYFSRKLPTDQLVEFSEGDVVRVFGRNAEEADFTDIDGVNGNGVVYWDFTLDADLQAYREVGVMNDSDTIENEYIYFYLETNLDQPTSLFRQVYNDQGMTVYSGEGGYLPNMMIINAEAAPEPEPVVPPVFTFEQNPDSVEVQENDTESYSLGSLTTSNLVEGETYSFTLHMSGGPEGDASIPGSVVTDTDGVLQLASVTAIPVDGDMNIKVWFTPEFDVPEGTVFDGPGFSEEDSFELRIVDTDGSGNPAPTPDPEPPTNVLTGTADKDLLEGGEGDQIIDGLDGDDRLYGNEGKDVITGGYGHDQIYGGQDEDTLYGNQGQDLIYGNRGDDIVYGGQGDDWLYGNQGADRIFGNKGRDSIWAGQDDDYIDGGEGNDHMLGNKGADVFHLSAGYDVIYDFDSFEGDSIETHVGSGLGMEQLDTGLLLTHNEGSTLLEGVFGNDIQVTSI